MNSSLHDDGYHARIVLDENKWSEMASTGGAYRTEQCTHLHEWTAGTLDRIRPYLQVSCLPNYAHIGVVIHSFMNFSDSRTCT